MSRRIEARQPCRRAPPGSCCRTPAARQLTPQTRPTLLDVSSRSRRRDLYPERVVATLIRADRPAGERPVRRPRRAADHDHPGREGLHDCGEILSLSAEVRGRQDGALRIERDEKSIAAAAVDE